MRTRQSLFTVIVFIYFLQNTECDDDRKKLSRVRRYLAFPEGALFSAVFCLTNLMGITPGSDIFSMNINWGLVYELPNETKPLLDVYKPAMKRRNKRDLYGRVETILNSLLLGVKNKKHQSSSSFNLDLYFHSQVNALKAFFPRLQAVSTRMGYDGRTCVLRSLCEAEQRFLKNEDSLLYKILSLIFRFPQEPLLNNEPDIHHTYHYASRIGRSGDNLIEYPEDIIDKCSDTFSCPFSLIDLALGYYSFTGT